MTIITLPFSAPVNTSLQVGDIIDYMAISTLAGSNIPTVSSSGSTLLGIVTNIGPTSINVIYDEVNVATPNIGDYIMFQKNQMFSSFFSLVISSRFQIIAEIYRSRLLIVIKN